jgi:hypothetical protein
MTRYSKNEKPYNLKNVNVRKFENGEHLEEREAKRE